MSSHQGGKKRLPVIRFTVEKDKNGKIVNCEPTTVNGYLVFPISLLSVSKFIPHKGRGLPSPLFFDPVSALHQELHIPICAP
jgi:hypothetical protein